jgi:hypothetical protein
MYRVSLPAASFFKYTLASSDLPDERWT